MNETRVMYASSTLPLIIGIRLLKAMESHIERDRKQYSVEQDKKRHLRGDLWNSKNKGWPWITRTSVRCHTNRHAIDMLGCI